MDRTTLGRTGIETSVVGLGAGGPSRLGQSAGRDRADSVALVRRALELGVTLIDTSELYGTEDIVGEAITGRRDEVVLSSKAYWGTDDRVRTPAELTEALERSLENLGTDRLDVYHLHAVVPDRYEEVRDTLVPVLEGAKRDGKIRAVAVSEMFGADPGHEMLGRALRDGWPDVVMVGFNVLNQSARERVFPLTRESGVGTLIMFAVRRALSRPERLREVVAELAGQGLLGEDLDPEDPLGFLVRDGGARSITEAAYRFCRDEPGVDVVLTGTGNVEHLAENVRALNGPPLGDEEAERLRRAFAGIDSVSAN